MAAGLREVFSSFSPPRNYCVGPNNLNLPICDPILLLTVHSTKKNRQNGLEWRSALSGLLMAVRTLVHYYLHRHRPVLK